MVHLVACVQRSYECGWIDYGESEMTDLEISRQLALAIGWKENQVLIRSIYNCGPLAVCVHRYSGIHDSDWSEFDYREWAVIGPIAQKFNCFPIGYEPAGWNSRFMWRGCGVCAETPQKAIAMAVINGVKK